MTTQTDQVLVEVADLLTDLVQTLGDLRTTMATERAGESMHHMDLTPLVDAITQSLGNLRVTAPPVEVRVEPPQVNLSPQVVVQPPSVKLSGWVMSVTGRDDVGRVTQVSFKPE